MARHNGHDAVHYQPLADLIPTLADSLLDVLASHGIAAYAGPALRHTWPSIPQPWMTNPVDRVFVDSAATEQATVLLREHLQGAQATCPPSACAGAVGQHERTDTAAWEQIMASYRLPSYGQPREAEPSQPEPGRIVRPSGAAASMTRPKPATTSPYARVRWGWALLLASPILLLLAAVFNWRLGGWLGAIGATTCLAGLLGLLVPTSPRPH